MGPVSVLIVDDHPLFRQGLLDVLEAEPGARVAAVAGDAENAIELALEHQPDVILMDINLPAGSGLRATRRILNELPSTKVVILTGYDDSEQMAQAIRAGAAGYCTKDIPPEELVAAIETVLTGQYVFDGQSMNYDQVVEWLAHHYKNTGHFADDKALDAFDTLTGREKEILELVAGGASNMEIALKLHISIQTVKNHLTAIFRKLNVADRTQAAIFALQHSWVEHAPEARQTRANKASL